MKSFIIIGVLMLLATVNAQKSRCRGDPSNIDTTSKVCSSCCCYKKEMIVDCTDININDLFTVENLQELNTTGVIVETLDLSYNNIKSVTVFPYMNIKYLNLSNNIIEQIEDGAFTNLTQLVVLDLSNNHLTTNNLKPESLHGGYSPTEFQPLLALKVLKLGNNNLHSLNKDLFEHTPALEELYLDTNQFKVIDYSTLFAIADLPNLRVIDLSYMELDSIADDIFHRPLGLQVVNLTGNLLTEIPGALRWATHLETLLLDENPIKNIEGEHIFPKMPNLKTLSISYTPSLTKIGKGAFSGLGNLTCVSIQNNNKLTYFDANAFSRPGEEEKERIEWPPIKHLYLNHNNLSLLESDLLGNWNSLETVDFTHNPWTCDCENQWLVDVLMPIIMNENNSHLIQDVMCQYPVEMEGKHISDLAEQHSHMRCVDAYGNRPERDGVILVGILVGLLIGIPLTLGLVWLHRQGYLGCFGSRGPADFSRAFYKRTGNQEDFHI